MTTFKEISKFVNLTPHEINVIWTEYNALMCNNDCSYCYLFDTAGCYCYVKEHRDFPPSGTVARVSTNVVGMPPIDGIPTEKVEYGEVTDLPEPVDGTMYIVSLMVKQACPDRLDLLTPGELMRDKKGNPIGCCGLRR